jgi:hypothetical protein
VGEQIGSEHHEDLLAVMGWPIAFCFSFRFVDQFAVFGVHVPALPRIVLDSGIGVDPDWTGEDCDGSAD